MSPRHWPDRIRDILDTAAEIQCFIAGMSYEQFIIDPKTMKAVTADFAIIGEAANHIPESIRGAHPEIDWDGMRRMRNIIVHVYHGIDAEVVWGTAKNDLPSLIPLLNKLIADENS